MRVYQFIIAVALLSSCAEFVTMTELSPGARLTAAGHRVIAYYPGWTSEGRNPYEVADIPGHLLTHVNYAFANVGAESGQIAIGYPHLDVDRAYPGDPAGVSVFGGHFRQLLKLKQRHPHLKTLISVGGWTWSGNFSAAAETDEKRQRFARSCAAFAGRFGFDGVDIDWEYPNSAGLQPGRPEDRENFTQLLQSLRKSLDAQAELDGRDYLLTFAAPGGIGKLDALDVSEIHQYLDFINVMTYDFAGSWSDVTQFNSPLYGTTDPAQPQDRLTTANADAVLRHLLAGGVPPEKLVMGLPFNGKSFAGVHDANDGLYQTFDGDAPTGLRTSWRELRANELYGMQRRWHEEAKSPWLYDAHKGITVVYEDPESARLKAEYVRGHSLGGVMFWQITSDDDDHSMVRALVEGLLTAGEEK
jgi:chitinase